MRSSSSTVDPVRARRRRVRRALLSWAAREGRHFPWRAQDTSPYAVFVAEILLKRTTARAVSRTFGPFLDRFDSLASIDAARSAELERALEGVGLQKQRARAFKEIAQHLKENSGAIVPDNLEALSRIPHVGPYTSRAVMSFAYGVAAAVVDSNVQRVLGRLFRDSLGSQASIASVQEAADCLLPRSKHREFNWALLDLGALVCRYDRPRCEQCPLAKMCDYAGHL